MTSPIVLPVIASVPGGTIDNPALPMPEPRPVITLYMSDMEGNPYLMPLNETGVSQLYKVLSNFMEGVEGVNFMPGFKPPKMQ